MDLAGLLAWGGVPLVFAAVLLEQGGLPLPAAPVVIAAGALASAGDMRPEQVLLASIVACIIADHAWFLVGRRHGRRVLGRVCRLSLSPDACVRQTDDLIARHGAALLVVAKFIPGLSAVAIPTAAAMGVPYRRFVIFDAAGCAAWSGLYVGAGMIFSHEINRLLEWTSAIGGWSLALAAALVAAYVGVKIAHRHRLRRLHRLVRITAAETASALERDAGLLIVDARSGLARERDPRSLPRSVVLGDRLPGEVLPADARERTIVTFCTCPSEASAALLAEQLIRAGYSRVRVLTGGEEALDYLTSAAYTSRGSG